MRLRTLDDLTDTLSLEQELIRLDERIVDVRDVAQGAVRVLGGPGSPYEIRSFLPAAPLFVFVDPARLERVLINLLSKVMQYAPQGGRIDLSVSRRTRAGGVPAGIEIICHEAGNEVTPVEDSLTGGGKSILRASGPGGQDLLRHWVSENGFGLTLAQKIVEVHGGTVTAAGLAGTSVVLTLAPRRACGDLHAGQPSGLVDDGRQRVGHR